MTRHILDPIRRSRVQSASRTAGGAGAPAQHTTVTSQPPPRGGRSAVVRRRQVAGRLTWATGDRSWGDDGGMSVDVTVLYFAGCPSWQTTVQRVHAAAVQAGVHVVVSTQAVETLEEAQRLAFAGSPTIWPDRTDPFAQPDTMPALACRVYASPDGLAGSPTVGQMVDALTQRAD